MSKFIYQQKQAWETLKTNRGFVFAVVMTMGITLGALICILSLAWLLVVKPLPYPDQERLFRVDQDIFNATGQRDISAYTYPTLLHLFKNQTEFNESALISHGSSVDTSAVSQPTINIAFVTHQWFSLLGAKYELGRGFDESESIDNHVPVAVLSYNTWINDYNKNPDILSQSATFNGVSYKIIGVLSEDFHEPQIYEIGRQTGVWLPWEFNASSDLKDGWGSIRNTFTFVGKLDAGLSASHAEQRITHMIDTIWRDNVVDVPFFNGWRLEMKLKSFEDIILGDSKTAAYLLLAGIIGLVVIACVNIANLFISKTVQQQKELAIHAALGAKRSQIFGSLFAQTNQLMFFSIVIALPITAFGFDLFQRFLSNLLPRMEELRLGLDTIGLGVGLMLLFALLFTWVCSRVIDYRELNLSLNSSGKGSGVQVSEKSRTILIISQVAIATALVFCNLVLLKNALNTINTPLGIDLENKHSVSLTVRAHAWPSMEETAPFMQELIAELSTFPQIEEINQSPSPLSPFGKRAITVVSTNEKLAIEHKYVAPGYFKFMGQPMLEGTPFTKDHIIDWRSVMIVNDVFADYLAPEGSAVGMKIDFGDDRVATIIGVVKGMRLPGESEIPKRFYGPESPGWAQLLIKLKENQEVSRQSLVDLINKNTTLYSLYFYQDLEKVRNERLFAQITTAITTAVLSVLTFLLAGIGLFGILSYVIQMRKFEIGIRMAIGANRADLIKLIVKESFVSVAFGVVVAVGLLLLIYTLFEQQIGLIELQDSLALFALTLGLISMLSLFACYAPLKKYINRPSIYCLRGTD